MENNNNNNSIEKEEALIQCTTTKGPMTMKLVREWSPNGYDRAVELFERHFYDGSHFFRVVPNFLVQFGISYSTDKELQGLARKSILDDPKHPDQHISQFKPGTISYAGSGPNSRTSQLFISYGHAKSLGTQLWETPIGEVIVGMDTTVTQFYSYGDMPPWGEGPVQGKIHGHPEYIENNFPLTDKFIECHVERLLKGGQSKIDVDGKIANTKEERMMEEEPLHDEKRERKQRHRDLRNPELFEHQRQIMKKQQQEAEAEEGNTMNFAIVAFVILMTLGLLLVFLKRRRKDISKTN